MISFRGEEGLAFTDSFSDVKSLLSVIMIMRMKVRVRATSMDMKLISTRHTDTIIQRSTNKTKWNKKSVHGMKGKKK